MPAIVLPSTHAGIDKDTPPSGDDAKVIIVPKKGGPKPNFSYEWMHTLFRRSNFSFTGCYLTHQSKNPAADDPKWREVFPKFLEQGWGFFYIFVGYSYRQDLKLTATNFDWTLSSKAAKELGFKDAKMLKDRAARIGYEAQGAIVFLDNEDQNPPADHKLSEEILDYYEALLAECRIARPEAPPVRPGFYGCYKPIEQVMSRPGLADLYLWRCDPMGSHPKEPYPTIYDTKTVPGKLISPLELYPLIAVAPAETERTHMVLGRQWVLWGRGSEGIPDASGAPWLRKCTHIDFNSSMVRDPRYPIAEPRIAAVGDITLQGYFNRKSRSMHIDQVNVILPPVPFHGENPEEPLEPDAPILLTTKVSPEVYTLGKNGAPVLITAKPNQSWSAPWVWALPTKLIKEDTGVILRRNRAMGLSQTIINETLDTQLFFVSQYHVLMGIRRVKDGSWTDPMSIQSRLHPFSSLAVTNRGTTTVDLFYLDEKGCLSTTWLPRSGDKDWPLRAEHGPLQTGEQTLILDGPLAAIAPSEQHLLVFGIGKDLMLHMTVYTQGKGWSQDPLAPVQGLQPKDSKLFAHASLDVYSTDEQTVYVATVTEVNEPCVYILRLIGGRWKLRGPNDRKYFPNKVSALSPPGAAVGYTFNPYGDIKLSVLYGNLVLWMPAVAKSGLKTNITKTALLVIKVLEEREETCWLKVQDHTELTTLVQRP